MLLRSKKGGKKWRTSYVTNSFDVLYRHTATTGVNVGLYSVFGYQNSIKLDSKQHKTTNISKTTAELLARCITISHNVD